MTLYICTTGTSIASGPPQIPLAQRITDKEARSSARHGTDVVAFLHEISAETNGLARDNCGPGDTVVLLASDTDDGRTCAEAVATLVRANLGATVRIRTVPGLTVKAERSFRQEGIRNLIGIIQAETRNASEPVVFNATGGFKGVVPYLTLMGMFLNVPVHYVFEMSDAVIRLPPLPVRFDLDRLGFAEQALRALAGAAGGQMREAMFLQLLPRRGHGDDEIFHQLIEVSEGNVALSAAGELALSMIQAAPAPRDRLHLRHALAASPLMASQEVRYALPRIADSLLRRNSTNCHTFGHAPGILVCKTASGNAPRLYYEVNGGIVHVLEILDHKHHDEFVAQTRVIPFDRYRSEPIDDMTPQDNLAVDPNARMAEFVEHVLGDEALAELTRERDAAQAQERVASEQAERSKRRLEAQDKAAALTRKAALWAADAFAGKTRKDGRTPYVNHLMQVVALLEEAGIREGTVLAAGWLHDAIEDVGATKEQLATDFGADVAALIAEVSDDKSVPKDERKRLQIVNAVHKSDRARLITLADKTANLRDLWFHPAPDWDEARRLGYALWARDVVAAFAQPSAPPEMNLRAGFAEALARFNMKLPH